MYKYAEFGKGDCWQRPLFTFFAVGEPIPPNFQGFWIEATDYLSSGSKLFKIW